MRTPRISDIIGIINKIAPPALAEDWDNPGLQLGDLKAPVQRIMVALDPLEATVDAAITSSCSLLVTHHPLFFRPLRKLDPSDPVGGIAFRAIRGELAIISLHTNYDCAAGGLNDILAERIGLTNIRPLRNDKPEELVKLAVFVPKGHEEKVLSALFRFSGVIGNYRDCSFRADGTGTFTPLTGATPFVGTIGTREEIEESRVEVLLRREDAAGALKALAGAHPYEEPAVDLYPLLNRGAERGLGRLGELPAETTLEEFAAATRSSLGCTGLRYVGAPAARVRRVAVCSGSGASLLREAARGGADVLVTGDVKYHEAREAESLGIGLIDAGHFPTEIIMAEEVTRRLAEELKKRGFDTEVIPATIETDPFRSPR